MILWDQFSFRGRLQSGRQVLACGFVSLFRGGERNHGAGPVALQDGRDPLRCAVGDGPKRVVSEVCIPFCGSRLPMAKHLTDEIEAVPARYRDRCK